MFEATFIFCAFCARGIMEHIENCCMSHIFLENIVVKSGVRLLYQSRLKLGARMKVSEC